MDDNELDRLLSLGRATTTASPDVLDAVLTRLSDDAQKRSRSSRKRVQRRWMPVIGVALAVGVVATAGAIYAAPAFAPDAIIPITYTTDTGREVHCTYSLAVSTWDGADENAASAATKWIAEHDWTGIGQRGYDYAVAHPVEAGNPGVDPAIPQNELDRSTVSQGFSTEIIQEIPEHLLAGPGIGTVATSTCGWELH